MVRALVMALLLSIPFAHALPLAQTYGEDFEDGAPDWEVYAGAVVCATPPVGCALRLEGGGLAYPVDPALGVVAGGPLSVAAFDVRFGTGSRSVSFGLGQVTLGGTQCTLHADHDSVWVSSGTGMGEFAAASAPLAHETWYRVELQQRAHELVCTIFDAQGAPVGSAATTVLAEWTPLRFPSLATGDAQGAVWVDDLTLELAI